MFVPIEPAFLLALQNDEALWHDAYSRGVLLAGPTTILFVIRIVADLWHQQRQADNVEKVMKRGTELYDKFVGFVSNLESVGSSLYRCARMPTMRRTSNSPPDQEIWFVKSKCCGKLGVAPKNEETNPYAKMLEAAELETDESNTGLSRRSRKRRKLTPLTRAQRD
jgi:hypothetical protein